MQRCYLEEFHWRETDYWNKMDFDPLVMFVVIPTIIRLLCMGPMGAVMLQQLNCFLGVDMRNFMCIINTHKLKELRFLNIDITMGTKKVKTKTRLSLATIPSTIHLY